MNKLAHILLVEDNRMDVELTLDAFHEAKLVNTIHVASNGQEALDYLFGRGKYADRSAFPMPNLVLLDLKLPGIDGFEVLRQVKSTPILALSYDQGANSYLVKPVSFDGFLGVVRQIEGYWLSLNIAPPESET
jgi:DNA-binding response OmpR family regulator